jgi:hypothetical protein
MWSRVLRTTNHFDTFLQIDATPETKFDDEDDYEPDRRGAPS